jgi:hypothetical protein
MKFIPIALLFASGKLSVIDGSSSCMKAFAGYQAELLQKMHPELQNDSDLVIGHSFEAMPLTSDPGSRSLSWPFWVAIAVSVIIFVLIIAYVSVVLWRKYRYLRFASNIRNVI